jgi:hypothetical protein
MKYIISESKLESFIREYLNYRVRPDYSTGINPQDLHDFYQRDVKKYGSYSFTIDDEEAYRYFRNGVIFIQSWLVRKLSGLFGDLWHPIFKSWFEEITGLHVEGIQFGV